MWCWLRQLKAKGIEAKSYICDVTDEEQVKNMVADIEKELGVIDILLGLSCMGNAGVAFGVAYTFYDLPDVTKLVCCLCMIIGRLEIFTFLAMLQPGFWKRNSNW